MTDKKLQERIQELEAHREKFVREANLELANINGRIAELQKLLDGDKEPAQEAASGAG